MKMIIGVIVGLMAAWFYSSERARKELQQRFSEAPQVLEQLQHTGASLAATGAQRVAEVIDSTPLPGGLKDTASGAAFKVSAAADKLAQPESGVEIAQGAPAPAES